MDSYLWCTNADKVLPDYGKREIEKCRSVDSAPQYSKFDALDDALFSEILLSVDVAVHRCIVPMF